MAEGFDNTTPQGERVAFCQDCGRPLTAETMRTVGSGVFCDPCLVQRVGSGSVPPPPPAGGSYTGGFGSGVPPAGAVPPVPPANLPNPAAAGWLAVIPGAGAVYNGQYAKGLVIFVIFMVLSSLGDSHSIFGLAALVFWIFQIIDAHHTAKARILGLPLPNPFGLNDIGDRMGFGKNWPGSMANPVPTNSPVNPAPTASTPQEPVQVPPVPPSNWAGYVHPSNFAQSAQVAGASWNPAPYQAPVENTPYTASTPYTTTQPWTASASGAPVPPANAPSRRFPIAAVVLILLGLFALTNSVMHLEISASWITALVLAVFGVWALTHRLQQVHRDYPSGADSATAIACVLRGPGFLMIVLAVLFTLQAAHALTLGQTWPVIVIAVGLQLLIQRSVDRATHVPEFNAPAAGAPVWSSIPHNESSPAQPQPETSQHTGDGGAQ